MPPARLLLAAALLATQAAATSPAAPRRPATHPVVHARTAAPVRLGRFNDWQAATHLEGGRATCYAFTRARHSQPRLAGRGDVVLTVTQRPHGRDQVAINAGFAFAPTATASMTVAGHRLDFYTAGRSAFARHGADAVAAFLAAEDATSAVTGPHLLPVSDGFSLNGFGAAYAAIRKACPTP